MTCYISRTKQNRDSPNRNSSLFFTTLLNQIANRTKRFNLAINWPATKLIILVIGVWFNCPYLFSFFRKWLNELFQKTKFSTITNLQNLPAMNNYTEQVYDTSQVWLLQLPLLSECKPIVERPENSMITNRPLGFCVSLITWDRERNLKQLFTCI